VSDDYRTASRQSWSAVADDWGELIATVDRQLAPAVEWMLRAAAPRAGETVLELAGGPGTVSLAAARAVGETGRVICTDFAEPMVNVARRRAEREGVTNIEFRTADAEALDLPDGSVDVVLCRMGYMLMADPAAALRESGRVLRDGGRLALAVWAEAEANPWAMVPMRAIMQQLGAPPPPAGAPGLWALGDGNRLRELLAEAGLDQVETEHLDAHNEYDSASQWLELTGRLAGPLRALMASLDADTREAIGERVEQAAGPFRQSDGRLRVPERILAAAAVRR
jgi:SAM-dependent methyltransferase